MLKRLLSGLGSQSRSRRVPRMPPDTVLWAVGDIHGRSDLLATLLEIVTADLLASGQRQRIFVGLGDYVDKGPDSRGVLDLLVGMSRRPDVSSVFIRGNHEAFFERFLSEPAVGPNWCEHGGREALNSYGAAAPPFRGDTEGWAETSARLNVSVPAEHRAFLSQLTPSFSCGDYFFAHAGARPGVALVDQTDDDLMWVRGEFTRSAHVFEQVVVHGHTPSPAFHMDERRIGLDTGAYATGILTAMRFEGDHKELLQVRGLGGRIFTERRPIAH